MSTPINPSTTVDIPEEYDLNMNPAIEALRIDPTEDLSEPPVYCKISGSPAMTDGNLSLIIGKAKSGKTFLLGSVVASMVNNSIQLGVLEGSLPEFQKNILYFDTEQSHFHANRTIKRICSIAGLDDPVNLIAYGLRPLTPEERLAVIAEKIATIDNIGLVVIDGVRDLLTMGINDEAEATTLISKFLKWTSEYHFHLIVLLHQNKTDLNARGVIGTELLNKAETTISITRDKKGNIFVVSCEYSRDIAFDDFAFTIADGLPVEVEIPSEGQVKAGDPKRINDLKHFEVLNNIFRSGKKPNYRELQDGIIYSFGNLFGQSKSRAYITHYKDNGWIEPIREGKVVIYRYNRATF